MGKAHFVENKVYFKVAYFEFSGEAGEEGEKLRSFSAIFKFYILILDKKYYFLIGFNTHSPKSSHIATCGEFFARTWETRFIGNAGDRDKLFGVLSIC